VYAVSKNDGIVLHVGQSLEEKFSAQVANTTPITYLIDGQFFYPGAPRREKTLPVGFLFIC